MMNAEVENEYITLKEASERFGYAPDYIGQLIRKGKIEGKQVYANVAWVTTVRAMEAYVSKEKARRRRDENHSIYERFIQALLAPRAGRIIRSVLVLLAVCLLALFVPLFYMISVAVDHRISRERAARMNEELPTIAEEAANLARETSGEALFVYPVLRP